MIVEGFVDRVIASRPGGWCALVVRPRGRKAIVCVGSMETPRTHMYVRAEGKEVVHPKFGNQLRADKLLETMPPDNVGVRRWLEAVEGIGPEYADDVVDAFGDETLEVLRTDPERVGEIKGIGPKRAKRIAEFFKDWDSKREALKALMDRGLTSKQAVKVSAIWKDSAVERIDENPYSLLVIPHMGFKTVDALAVRMGVEFNDSRRLRAGIGYVIEKKMLVAGHCWLPPDDFVIQAAETLESDGMHVEPAIEDEIRLGPAESQLAWVGGDRAPRLYSARHWKAEKRVKDRLLVLASGPGAGYNENVAYNALGLTPSAGQLEVVRTVNRSSVTVVTGGPGTGKCVEANTRVRTTRGLAKIASLTPRYGTVENDFVPIAAVDAITRDGPRRADSLYYGGEQSTRRITTHEGYTLSGTQEHCIVAAHKSDGMAWKALGDVTPGDYVAIWRDGKTVDGFDPWAYLLGVYTADGWTSPPNRPTGVMINNPEPEIWDFLERDIKKLGLKANHLPCHDKGPAKTYYISKPGSRRGSRALVGYLAREWGMVPAKSTEKRVPERIFIGSLLSLKSFLTGLFDGDGHSQKRGGGIELGLSNLPLLTEVQLLLLEFGIVGSIVEKPHVDSWTLVLSGKDASLFYERIGFRVKRKQAGADRLPKRRNPNRDVVPCLGYGLLRGYIRQLGKKDRKWWWKWKREAKGERRPSQDRLQKLIDEHNVGTSEEVVLREMCDPRIFWAEVIDVSVDIGEVYDLCVPDGHEFQANGFISHNSTSLRALATAAEIAGHHVELCAPTGRAARRITELTGFHASTIHRLLEWSPEGFRRNALNPLDVDFLAMDEGSMTDIWLAERLLSAIPDSAVVVIVGDVDQLPSVGPGAVLRDIIDSKKIPTVILRTIHRQAMKSPIIVAAHEINNSSDGWRSIANLQQLESPAFGLRLCRQDVRGAESYRFVRETILSELRRFRDMGLDLKKDVQVLAPMKKGAIGVHSLNELVGEEINPVGTGVRDFTLGGFAVGDRVIHIRNNYQLKVFNGMIGVVTDAEERMVSVEYGNGRRQLVVYDNRWIEQLMQAFVITIHKSQGSEFKAAIVVNHSAHHIMLRRQLLYTAITRAKECCVVVGDASGLGTAINRADRDIRNTSLTELLRGDITDEDADGWNQDAYVYPDDFTVDDWDDDPP